MIPARLVILNGKIAEEEDVLEALDLLQSEGPLDVRVTRSAGEAERYAAIGAADGVDEIFAFGGDGTLSEVVAGLVPGEPDAEAEPFSGILAVIPRGTANDFARCAGIPSESPRAAVEALATSRPVALDVGRLVDGVRRPFINVATAGFGAEASTEASAELKDVLGKVAYLVAGLAKVGSGEAEPREAVVRAPDFERRLAFHLLAVGNGRCAGGGMSLCPDADPADGLFDVTIVPVGSVGDAVAEVVRNGIAGIGEAGIRFRAPWVEIESDRPLQVNLDGEPASADRFRFEVEPGALRVMLPVDSPLL